MDANEYALKMQPADKALGLVLRQAQWVSSGRPAAEEEPPEPLPERVEPSSLAAVPAEESVPASLPDELHLDTGVCAWRVRGWKKNTSPEAMRVNVQVRCGKDEGSESGYHMDTLDLYGARSRAAFVRQAAIELGLGEDGVKRELGEVLLRLEALQDALMTQGRQGSSTAPAVPVLSADDEARALELLRAPDLMRRVVDDLHALGVVGEEMNLMAAYLAAVSRKLDAPLAVLIQSSSAAGKSSLMDAVLQLIPVEERIRYSAMTGQSLFYLGETNLQHKILAIAEEEGVRQAAYALKLLQSDGELTIASTAKDEASGNLTTKQYTVKGPVMLMLTTTAIDVDEELMNRCLVLAVNESREQTAAIHVRQRQRQTLEGLLQSAEREAIQALHHNAQRLLSAVKVVNPYANALSFAATKTRTRRDHMKYLSLIQAIALLHQHQREVKEVQHKGQVLSYIEVTRADIELANAVAHEVLGRTLDELPPQTRRLLGLIREMVVERAQAQRIAPADVRFTRRDVRMSTQWSDSQLKVHCARLTEMEYLLVHAGSRGHSLRYELLWDGGDDAEQRRRLCGLLDPGQLGDDNAAARVRLPQVWADGAQVDVKFAPSRPQVWVKSGVVNEAPSRADARLQAGAAVNGDKTHIKGLATSSSAAVVVAGH
jgi:hypothetical protein